MARARRRAFLVRSSPSSSPKISKIDSVSVACAINSCKYCHGGANDRPVITTLMYIITRKAYGARNARLISSLHRDAPEMEISGKSNSS